MKLKEINRSEAIDLMAGGQRVYMLYELSLEHTIGDLLGADAYVIEEDPGNNDEGDIICPVPGNNEEPRKDLEEPRSEVNEVNDEAECSQGLVNDEVKPDQDEDVPKKKHGGSQKRELPAEKTEKIIQMFKEGKNYNQISLYTGIGIGIVKRIVKEHDPEAAKAHAAGRGRKPGCEYNVPPKDERIDSGKIGALAKAGWNPEKIAYDMGIDLSAVNEVLNAERVDS